MVDHPIDIRYCLRLQLAILLHFQIEFPCLFLEFVILKFGLIKSVYNYLISVISVLVKSKTGIKKSDKTERIK